MAIQMRGMSPLTGLDVTITKVADTDTMWYDEADYLGEWSIAEELVTHYCFAPRQRFWIEEPQTSRPPDLIGRQLNENETDRLLALAASHVRRTQLESGRLWIMRQSLLDRMGGTLGPAAPGDRPATVEDLWREAAALTLNGKAALTLVNLSAEEPGIGLGVHLPIAPKPYPCQWIGGGTPEHATARSILYGCVENEGPMVLRTLLEGRLLRCGAGQPNTGYHYHVTSAGYAAVERIQQQNVQAPRIGFR